MHCTDLISIYSFSRVQDVMALEGRSSPEEGRGSGIHLLVEWLLTYRVHVPDKASKVSTPNEHRICKMQLHTEHRRTLKHKFASSTTKVRVKL